MGLFGGSKLKNLNLLFTENNKNINKIKLEKFVVKCRITSDNMFFSGKEIGRILSFINDVHKQFGSQKVPIEFYFGKIIFIDKLTYIFLECICYYLIEVYGHRIQIFLEVEHEIGTEGIDSSPLLLLNGTQCKSIKKYPRAFERDLYGHHLRRLVKFTDSIEESNYLGRLYQEIDTFLKPFGIDDYCRDKVALVITELIGNATEHAESDCLMDVDVTNSYHMKKSETNKDDDTMYYGINIAVVNFSDKLLGDNIRKNILNKEESQLTGRYRQVFNAHNMHKMLYNEEYGEDDFCNVTSFQHKISGRPEIIDDIGGTGLTKLIKSLQELSEAYRCYVISGNRCLNFVHDKLEYDKNGWIGFNEANDYINKIPDDDIATSCLIYMPGTAYNLNFIMKGEKSIERNIH